MMAMTTSSSIKVNPSRPILFCRFRHSFSLSCWINFPDARCTESYLQVKISVHCYGM